MNFLQLLAGKCESVIENEQTKILSLIVEKGSFTQREENDMIIAEIEKI